MLQIGKREAIILFIGDILIFLLSLLAVLVIRYGWPIEQMVFNLHIYPFILISVFWVFSFFIAGLYEKHTLILKRKIPSLVLKTQVINAGIAITFFYILPVFTITPKTNLLLYVLISSVFVLLWRLYGPQVAGVRRKENAVIIGSGEDIDFLKKEIQENDRYGLQIVSSIDVEEVDSLDFESDILKIIYENNVKTIIVDLHNPKVGKILPHLYNLIFSGIQYFDAYTFYEEVFNRLPLSLLHYTWFLENISIGQARGQALIKRFIDFTFGLILWLVALLFYPFITLAIFLEDQGSVFFSQVRVGENGKRVRLVKFRTMKEHKNQNGIASNPEVTKVGTFLRKTRLDELPQLWSVVLGDLSLVGPRPEIPDLVKIYEQEVPYYNIRTLVKPGLSGWAQLYHDAHPHHTSDVVETKTKLSYDLYYLKNQSFLLDLKIIFKTIKKLISRSGA